MPTRASPTCALEASRLQRKDRARYNRCKQQKTCQAAGGCLNLLSRNSALPTGKQTKDSSRITMAFRVINQAKCRFTDIRFHPMVIHFPVAAPARSESPDIAYYWSGDFLLGPRRNVGWLWHKAVPRRLDLRH